MSYEIFYFSGTGNSLKIAKDIAEKLGSLEPKGIRLQNRNLKVECSEMVGIVFPVYAFGMPNMVRNFLEGLEGVKKAFVIVSHGGMPGVALSQAKDIMEEKNIEVKGLYSIEMPDNYIIMFNREKEKKIDMLLTKQETLTEKIAEKLKNEDKSKTRAGGFRALKFINRLALKRIKRTGEGFYFDDKCIECEICQKVCPVENIYLEDGKPKWKDRCEGCMACIQWCPVESIQYKKRTLKKRRYQNPRVKLSEIIG